MELAMDGMSAIPAMEVGFAAHADGAAIGAAMKPITAKTDNRRPMRNHTFMIRNVASRADNGECVYG